MTDSTIKYFTKLPRWPEVDIYDKTIDGLIPSARLDSWEDFHRLVQEYRSEGESEYVFRGQQNYKWELQPTLDRMTPGVIHEEVARKQLRNFRLSIRGRVPHNAIFNEREEELWAIGQHHGLATPLLDWTLAPYVALFFSFVNEDLDTWTDEEGNPNNYSRVVYILNKTFIEDLLERDEEDPISLGYPKIVEPSKDDHGRLVNQAGLFTIAPYGETIESSLIKALEDSEIEIDDPTEVSKYICKVHIPNSSDIRRECLRHLRKMNIHHASLFPDVIGASGYCNELISEFIALSKKPISTETQYSLQVEESVQQKDFVLTETDDVKRSLLLALIVDDYVKDKISESSLKNIVKAALEFIEEKAGVDWYVRESQLSRLNIIVRRSLKKIQFPDDFIEKAARSFVSNIAQLSAEKDREERIKKGSLIDIPRQDDSSESTITKE